MPDTDNQTGTGVSDSRHERLDSWKEIAAHLGRTVRTVQRWERTCGLPVHRHGHRKSASIYAYRAELDAWWTTQRHPVDVDTATELSAPDLCALSRHYWATRTIDGLQRGIALAEQAIARDPGYAPAYAAQAIGYVTLASYVAQPPATMMEKGRAAVRRALDLDPMQADAHQAFAFLLLCYDWDFENADTEFRRSVELDPNNASAWQMFAISRIAAGDVAQAIEFGSRAARLAPEALIVSASLAWILYFARRYSDALTEVGRAMRRDRAFWRTYFHSAWCHLQLGNYDKAVDAMETAVALNDYPGTRASLAHVYARAGRTQQAADLVASVLGGDRYASQYWLAIASVGLGDHATALAALERACATREWFLIFLNCEPMFDPLRGDRRFRSIAERVRR